MLLAFIAYATMSPIQARPTLLASANVERLGAFAVLGALFCLAYPRHMILVALIVLGSAVLLELAQLLTPDRHGRIQDAIVKMTGAALGIVAGEQYSISSQRTAGSRISPLRRIQLNERV
jgi:VanZ family protein